MSGQPASYSHSRQGFQKVISVTHELDFCFVCYFWTEISSYGLYSLLILLNGLVEIIVFIWSIAMNN